MNQAQVRDKKTGRLIILTVTLGVLMWSFSAGLVNMALPTISQYLDLGIEIVSWIIIIHLLVLTILIIIFGRIGDFVGYKTIFMTGVALFAVGSYLCAVSLNIYHLILFRALMGIGSAMLLSMAPAIISTFIPHGYRGRAFGYLSLATAIGLSLGYGVGGYITEFLGWRWIFFASIPFAILTIFLANRLLRNFKISAYNAHFDFKGALIIFFSLLIFILSIDMGDSIGWTSPLIIGGFIVSFILAVLFVFWDLRNDDSFFDLSILKNFNLTISITATFLTSLVFTGTIFLLPFYLELVMGYDTSSAGLIIFIPTLLVIIVSPASGYISDSIGSRLPVIIASLFLAISLIFLTFFDPTLDLLFIFMVLAVYTLSRGMFSPANNKMVMSHTPSEKIGIVSSMLNTASYLGLVMGVVLFQTIFNIYINSHTIGAEKFASGSAVQINAPVSVLLDGFQSAFMMGVMISVLIIFISFLYKESSETA